MRGFSLGGWQDFPQRWRACECNPTFYSRLKTFLPRNVTLNEGALSSSEGTTVLRFDPDNTGIGTIEERNQLDQDPGIHSVIEVEVSIRKLDDFELDRVAFMRIDVEGHEREVLKGATDLLERDRPVLLIEIEDRICQGNLEAVPNWLNRFGYTLKILDNGTDGLVEVSDVDEVAASGVNRFWFLPA